MLAMTSTAGQLVAEFPDGDDLLSLVSACGPLPVDAAVDCVMQAAEAIGFVLSQEGLPIDPVVLPSNLVIDDLGTLRIVYGRASERWTSSHEGFPIEVELANVDTLVDIFDRQSPNQQSESDQFEQHAAVYGLGCVLHFLLTGHTVHPCGTQMDNLLAHRDLPVPSLREIRQDVDVSLDAAFERMLAKQTADRYGSLRELILQLRRLGL